MSEQYPTQQEYQEALNEIFAHDAELYNYIMYCEAEEPAEFDLDALEERMYLTEDNKGEDMASKTDLIETKHVDTEQYEWIAYIPGKEVLAQGGDTEEEAIGRLWLASAGDMIALFLEIATSGEPSKGENT